MISPALYETRVLPFERYLADHLRPYGIHHCGNNLQRYTKAYSQVSPRFSMSVGVPTWLDAAWTCRMRS